MKHFTAINALLLLTATFDAQATLVTYTGTGGTGVAQLVSSSVSKVTWTADANLLGTFINNSIGGFDEVVGDIIAASPTISDTPNRFDRPVQNSGTYEISRNDFNSIDPGRTTWFGANAFVNYLNSINYGGSNHWQLPNAGLDPQGNPEPQSGQLGQLFYSELNGTANKPIPTNPFFSDQQIYGYWLLTEFQDDPGYSWIFNTGFGNQIAEEKFQEFYVWPISVPVPATLWLLVSSIIGLVGWKRINPSS